jgi:hypothetical protein
MGGAACAEWAKPMAIEAATVAKSDMLYLNNNPNGLGSAE